jgi:hypothetical protein
MRSPTPARPIVGAARNLSSKNALTEPGRRATAPPHPRKPAGIRKNTRSEPV